MELKDVVVPSAGVAPSNDLPLGRSSQACYIDTVRLLLPLQKTGNLHYSEGLINTAPHARTGA